MSSVDQTHESNGSPDDESTVTARARQFSHEAIDAAAGKAEDIERRIREESHRLGESAGATRDEVSEQINESLGEIRSYIRKDPVKAAGIAFAAGVLATLILRR